MTRALLSIALLACAAPAAAQFPAELTGRVIERGTARPIQDAIVEIESGPRAPTDASGAFVLRSARDGRVSVRVSHPGYSPLVMEAELVTGRTVHVLYTLDVAPIELGAIEVLAPPAAAGFVFGREAIERSGAHTLAQLVRAVPGVVVRSSSGAGDHVSIRGSSADEVLVLVDGVPVNDPMTGAADLSLVALQGIESVRVLPGARSAQQGGRAQAGVIVVETKRSLETAAALAVRAGSLGSAGADAEASVRIGAVAVAAGGRFDRRNGGFGFERPEALGGGTTDRTNADTRDAGGFASIAGATWRLRADHARVERGLPGPVHAPTPDARQTSSRSAVTGSWIATAGPVSSRVHANFGTRRMLHADPAPAVGTAYHDTTEAHDAGVRAEVEHAGGSALRRTAAAGMELRLLRLESTALDPDVVERRDLALFGRAALELARHRFAPRVSAALRGDRWQAAWIASHELSLHASLGAVAIDVAHRSAFTPPSASDQYFARGVAIEPNPDLEPERVRSEVELGVSSATALGAVPVALGASAYSADVDGMIVWAPDFRFVWSPRNRDVKRRGGEAWARADVWPGLQLGARAALARVTYDWPGDADTVQVVYRPRYTGGATIDWRPGDWSIRAEALYTGVRYATPGPSNDLPGYWDVDLALMRAWTRGQTRLSGALRVQRLLDNDDAFIHGYPEAGRTLAIELRVHAAERPSTSDRMTGR